MALVVEDFTGFETGDLVEVLTSGGTPSIISADQRTGSHSVRLTSGDSVRLGSGTTITTGHDVIIGAAVRFQDATPASAHTIIALADSSNLAAPLAQITTDGKILIRGIGGGTTDTSADVVFTSGEWHYVKIFIHVDNTVGSMEAFVDGVSVASLSGEDTYETDQDRVRFNGHTDLGNYDIDDFYLLQDTAGGSSSSDGHLDAEVFGYQQSKGATATPDAGIAGGAADDLDNGTWDLTDNGNDGDSGEYEEANDGGSNDLDGPNGDGNIDGDANIKAIKGMFRVNRAGGGAAQHYLALGDSGDGNSPQLFDDDDPPGDWGPVTTAITNFFVLTETVPTAAQDIRLGFGKGTGAGQDFFLYDSWGFLLHVPDVVAADDEDPYWIAEGEQQPVFGPFEVVSY